MFGSFQRFRIRRTSASGGSKATEPTPVNGSVSRSTIEHSNIPNIRTISSFLFHGFSRSDGLIPEIVALGGYISVGPAVLNGHAVNYRELVKKIPPDRLLVETDRTVENAAECPSVATVAAEVAKLRGLSFAELEAIADRNADAFICYNTSK